MKVMTLNVRNMGADPLGGWIRRAKAVVRLLEERKPDIVCLQECTLPQLALVSKGYKVLSACNNPVMIRKGELRALEVESFKLPKGDKWQRHCTYAWLSDSRGFWNVYNVHMDWSDNFTRQARCISDRIGYGNERVVVCGDYNQEWDPLRFSPFLEKGLHWVENHEPTFHDYTDGGTTIDHFLTNMRGCQVEVVKDQSMSDHYPVLL